MSTISPKKSLGQHFMRSKGVLEAMADAADVRLGDTVLEIGPGEGTLTEVLLEKGATVIALEKDERLLPLLQEKFSAAIGAKKLLLKEIDALDFDPSEISTSYKLVANIPYYITGAILEKFLSAAHQPSQAALLVQKEVAERIIARDKKESLLSISVKVYGQPKLVKTVSRAQFSPPPAVDSAILAIKNISKNFFQDSDEEKVFFRLVKAGFAHKRKKLLSNIEEIVDTKKVNLDKNIRAEDLSLKQWREIINTLFV